MFSDQIFRCAHFLERGAHQVTDFLVGQLGPQVGRNNDRVPAFDGVDALDNGGRFRVCRGRQRANHAQRLGEHTNITLGIFFNDPHGLVVNNVEQCRAGFALYLQKFAVVVAELGFIDGKLGNLFRHPLVLQLTRPSLESAHQPALENSARSGLCATRDRATRSAINPLASSLSCDMTARPPTCKKSKA